MLVMRKIGCLVNMAVLLVGFLVGSVINVDSTGVVKKKIRIHGFDCT